MAALLPESFIDHSLISEMKIGEEKFTVPWAMCVLMNNQCYLNGAYTTYSSPGDPVQMMVRRTKEGFEVKIPDGERYTPINHNPWFGSSDNDLVPVSKFI